MPRFRRLTRPCETQPPTEARPQVLLERAKQSVRRGTARDHATIALTANVHPKVVQERLGHASIAITLDLYSQEAPGMQQDAAATVAALVGFD